MGRIEMQLAQRTSRISTHTQLHLGKRTAVATAGLLLVCLILFATPTHAFRLLNSQLGVTATGAASDAHLVFDGQALFYGLKTDQIPPNKRIVFDGDELTGSALAIARLSAALQPAWQEFAFVTNRPGDELLTPQRVFVAYSNDSSKVVLGGNTNAGNLHSSGVDSDSVKDMFFVVFDAATGSILRRVVYHNPSDSGDEIATVRPGSNTLAVVGSTVNAGSSLAGSTTTGGYYIAQFDMDSGNLLFTFQFNLPAQADFTLVATRDSLLLPWIPNNGATSANFWSYYYNGTLNWQWTNSPPMTNAAMTSLHLETRDDGLAYVAFTLHSSIASMGVYRDNPIREHNPVVEMVNLNNRTRLAPYYLGNVNCSVNSRTTIAYNAKLNIVYASFAVDGATFVKPPLATDVGLVKLHGDTLVELGRLQIGGAQIQAPTEIIAEYNHAEVLLSMSGQGFPDLGITSTTVRVAIARVIDCPSGHIANATGYCVPCPAGTYETEGACQLCQTGTFSNTTGTSQCTPCPPATSAFHLGATECNATKPVLQSVTPTIMETGKVVPFQAQGFNLKPSDVPYFSNQAHNLSFPATNCSWSNFMWLNCSSPVLDRSLNWTVTIGGQVQVFGAIQTPVVESFNGTVTLVNPRYVMRLSSMHSSATRVHISFAELPKGLNLAGQFLVTFTNSSGFSMTVQPDVFVHDSKLVLDPPAALYLNKAPLDLEMAVRIGGAPATSLGTVSTYGTLYATFTPSCIPIAGGTVRVNFTGRTFPQQPGARVDVQLAGTQGIILQALTTLPDFSYQFVMPSYTGTLTDGFFQSDLLVRRNGQSAEPLDSPSFRYYAPHGVRPPTADKGFVPQLEANRTISLLPLENRVFILCDPASQVHPLVRLVNKAQASEVLDVDGTRAGDQLVTFILPAGFGPGKYDLHMMLNRQDLSARMDFVVFSASGFQGGAQFGPTTGQTQLVVVGQALDEGNIKCHFPELNVTTVAGKETATTVRCNTPASAVGQYNVQLTSDGESFTSIIPQLRYTVFADFSLSTVSPATIPANMATSIHVVGSAFTDTLVAKVRFNGLVEVTATVVNSTHLRLISPGNLPVGTAVLSVSLNGGKQYSTASVPLGVVEPSVTGVTPRLGPVRGNTSVTVRGANLLQVADNSSSVVVRIGTQMAAHTWVSETELVVQTPAATSANGGFVPVAVSINGGTTFTTAGIQYFYHSRLSGVSVSPFGGPREQSSSVEVRLNASVPASTEARVLVEIVGNGANSGVLNGSVAGNVVSFQVGGIGGSGVARGGLRMSMNGEDWEDVLDGTGGGAGNTFVVYPELVVRNMSVSAGPAGYATVVRYFVEQLLDGSEQPVLRVRYDAQESGNCSVVARGVEGPGSGIVECVSPLLDGGKTQAVVRLSQNGQTYSMGTGLVYAIVRPSVSSIAPVGSPLAGGTEVTVRGDNFVDVPGVAGSVRGLRVQCDAGGGYTDMTIVRVASVREIVVRTNGYGGSGSSGGQGRVRVSVNGGASAGDWVESSTAVEYYGAVAVNGSVPGGMRASGGTTRVRLTGVLPKAAVLWGETRVELRESGSGGWTSGPLSVEQAVSSGEIAFTSTGYGGSQGRPVTLSAWVAMNGQQYVDTGARLVAFDTPTVSRVSPQRLDPGQRVNVTVKGTGFVDTGSILVQFRETKLSAVREDTQTLVVQLVEDMPSGLLAVEVSLDGGQSFTATSPPVLLSIAVFCPATTYLFDQDADNSTGCKCVPGFYAPNGRAGEACAPCPPNAQCLGLLEKPRALAGYFNTGSGSSFRFTRCPNVKACTGGVDSSCAQGYTGRLCAQCSTGYYRVSNDCAPCDNGSESATQLVLIALVVYVLVLMGIKRLAAMAVSGQTGVVSIVITNLQVLAMFADFQLQWPESTQNVLNGLGVLNLDVSVGAPDCQSGLDWGVETKFWVSMCLPVVLWAGMLLRLGLQAMHHGLVQRFGSKFEAQFPRLCRKPGVEEGLLHHVRYQFSTAFTQSSSVNIRTRRLLVNEIMLSLSLLYITLCTQVLQMFDCTEVNATTRVLDAQPDMVCYVAGGKHVELVGWASVFLLVYVVGIPVLFVTVMRVRGGTRGARLEARFAERFSTLYSKYRDEWYQFEAVVMLRKVMIVAVRLFATFLPTLQGLLGFIVLGVASVIQAVVMPYRTKTQNRVELLLLTGNAVCMVAGLVFLNQREIGRAAADAWATCVIVLVVGIVCVAVSSLALDARRLFVRWLRGSESKKAQGSLTFRKRLTETLTNRFIRPDYADHVEYALMHVVLDEDDASELHNALEQIRQLGGTDALVQFWQAGNTVMNPDEALAAVWVLAADSLSVPAADALKKLLKNLHRKRAAMRVRRWMERLGLAGESRE